MNRVNAVCIDCKATFAADETFVEAQGVWLATSLAEGVSRTAAVCPSCTSTHIKRA